MVIIDSVDKLKKFTDSNTSYENVLIKGIKFNSRGDFPTIFSVANSDFIENVIFKDCIFPERESALYTNFYSKEFVGFINVRSSDNLNITSDFGRGYPLHVSVKDSKFDNIKLNTGMRSLHVEKSRIHRLEIGGKYNYPEVSLINSNIDNLMFLDSSNEFDLKNYLIHNCNIGKITFNGNIRVDNFGKEYKTFITVLESDIEKMFNRILFINSDISNIKFNNVVFLDHIMFSECNISGADFTGVHLRHGHHGLLFRNCTGIDEIKLPDGVSVKEDSTGLFRSSLKGRLS